MKDIRLTPLEMHNLKLSLMAYLEDNDYDDRLMREIANHQLLKAADVLGGFSSGTMNLRLAASFLREAAADGPSV